MTSDCPALQRGTNICSMKAASMWPPSACPAGCGAGAAPIRPEYGRHMVYVHFLWHTDPHFRDEAWGVEEAQLVSRLLWPGGDRDRAPKSESLPIAYQSITNQLHYELSESIRGLQAEGTLFTHPPPPPVGSPSPPLPNSVGGAL